MQWEQETEAKLLRENEKVGNLRDIAFDRTELLRMDSKTERIAIQELNNGGLSWQEYRLARDMNNDRGMRTNNRDMRQTS